MERFWKFFDGLADANVVVEKISFEGIILQPLAISYCTIFPFLMHCQFFFKIGIELNVSKISGLLI